MKSNNTLYSKSFNTNQQVAPVYRAPNTRYRIKNPLFKIPLLTLFLSIFFFSCDDQDIGRMLDNPDPLGVADHCEFTDATPESPHYISNVPESVNLNIKYIKGTSMRITGTVYGGESGEAPLNNVRIEVWHPDETGIYQPDATGDISDFDENEINLRGAVTTDSEGTYNFISIQPGLNENDDRRRHIYYRIVAAGHKTLITQTYWQSEKGNIRDFLDTVDPKPEPCRYLVFQNDLVSGGIIASFDIYLEKE